MNGGKETTEAGKQYATRKVNYKSEEGRYWC